MKQLLECETGKKCAKYSLPRSERDGDEGGRLQRLISFKCFQRRLILAIVKVTP
jgi:hypothetical protein